MTPETENIPDWARRQREEDPGWIVENLDVFWLFASLAYEDTGRGAIVVDTRVQPIPGAGHPVGYFSQEQIEEKDKRIKVMVHEYHPTQEYVLVLLRPGDVVSTYRVGIVPSESWEEVANEATPSRTTEPASEPKLDPPGLETLMEWEAEGGCEAACPHQCWVEPDGAPRHGEVN